MKSRGIFGDLFRNWLDFRGFPADFFDFSWKNPGIMGISLDFRRFPGILIEFASFFQFYFIFGLHFPLFFLISLIFLDFP